MKYYTYELIDPRDNKVFYVGKGTNKRMYSHYASVKNGNIMRNENFSQKLKELVDNNLKPIYKKVIETNIEQEAFDKEIELIKQYGKNNLCNLTDGGEGGFCDIKHQKLCSLGRSKAWKNKKKKKISTDKQRQTILEKSKNGTWHGWTKHDTFTGRKHTPETIEKMKKAHKGMHKGKLNSQFGTIWITNGKENKKILKTDQIPNNWNKGRISF
ncbi:MAG: hypothetical protein JETCAE03_34190 [Ignavibacteriaceae bacterium]|jgi:hypothetical protein|nr:MAG: hypothetical protein JETCAE03_34190 [Ignavibacteriaceae bacterium]